MAGLSPPRQLAEQDPRETFRCGRPALDIWFHRHAWRNQLLGVSRTSVIIDRQSSEIAGYVSLSSAQIERGHLLKSDQRNRPDPVPAILLAQLAVDIRYQRQGVARDLLFFALTTSRKISDEIGCFCVLTHPLDEGVRSFYRRFGFEDLPFDPRRSMAVRIVDLIKNGF
ncbi:GNAT family N-acetyltransferase [Pararhizobium sp.]|uniref:GNAT family N-acetyltransferase n=1 Tax=Pararhizobium sp. TaxID=1977563 RepID=UPI00271E709C|nr:GNAT family N-acetyltransferase [Pararhizobium sp.]MDO9415277.1 GNAT family N-acetyltransferase [Pararhizobium sp.]